jgi:2-dehydro-3-deoxyglucarate aldolase/4-hydroxy-2-oxoheptanedioate aldolase
MDQRGAVHRAADLAVTSLLSTLEAETPLVGTVLSSPDALLAERAAGILDFLWIDLEHSALGRRDAQLLAVAARSGGAYALVRLPRFDSDLLTAVLDMGVDGIVAPKLNTGEEAEQLARSVRYPPRGDRGFAPRRKPLGEGATGVDPLQSRIAVVAQIETKAAMDNLDAIAATDGIDALVVGANDLLLDLGHELDHGSPILAEAVAQVGAAARRHSKAWGAALGALPAWTWELRARGAGMLVLSSDVSLYSEAIKSSAVRMRNLPDSPFAD